MANTYTFDAAHTDTMVINEQSYYLYDGWACKYGETWQAITEEEAKVEPKAKYVYGYNHSLNDKNDQQWSINLADSEDERTELIEDELQLAD